VAGVPPGGGPSWDEALVTRVPDGRALSEADAADLADGTLAAVVGGAVPVPGGAGVVEAGLIAGLASAGIPQDQAAAAVLIQRLFTAYLPPGLGMVHPGLDAPPRVRMTWPGASSRIRSAQKCLCCRQPSRRVTQAG
jgi:hypothetical protein